MPKTGGFPAGSQSNVVKKLPSLPEMAIAARNVRKAAMDAITTSSRMPEPRDRPRKILSPGRVGVAFAGGGGGGLGGESGGITVVVMAVLSGLGGRGALRAAPGRRCTGWVGRAAGVYVSGRGVLEGRGRPVEGRPLARPFRPRGLRGATGGGGKAEGVGYFRPAMISRTLELISVGIGA
ncbi:hypothetical protein GCM10018773_36810 [Streptomyces candidus]|nr:hypothetical protein GCM10018773_36810 [Streptomyces candidus]